MFISIIIPTYNEAETIDQLVCHLIKYGGKELLEVIVTDGGSSDNTLALAQKAGAKVVVLQNANRAIQMNKGAKKASGDILYFVHADTLPPRSFANDIQQAVSESYSFGRYRSKYKSSNFLLRLNAFFTRFNLKSCKGGDQSMFISKELFFQHNGYDEQYCIMEEYEFQSRLGKEYRYKIIPKNILISARKYEQNSYLAVQRANLSVFHMYKKGATPVAMSANYKRLLFHRSL